MSPLPIILATLWLLILTFGLAANDKAGWAIAAGTATLFFAFLSAVAIKDVMARPDEFDPRKVDAEWERVTKNPPLKPEHFIQ